MYGITLRQVWAGEISVRLLATYADQLPPGSMLRRSIGDNSALSSEGLLLMEVIDRLKALEAQNAGQKKFTPYPRPVQQRAEQERQENKTTGPAYVAQNAHHFEERERRRLAAEREGGTHE